MHKNSLQIYLSPRAVLARARAERLDKSSTRVNTLVSPCSVAGLFVVLVPSRRRRRARGSRAARQGRAHIDTRGVAARCERVALSLFHPLTLSLSSSRALSAQNTKSARARETEKGAQQSERNAASGGVAWSSAHR